MVMLSDGSIYERTEQLYVSDEYKLFLVTGQPQDAGGRKAFITARAFNSLDTDSLAALKEKATVLDGSSRISISRAHEQLKIYDGFTYTASTFPIEKLDEDVRARFAGAVNNVWDKFLPNATVKTGQSIAVKKPLQLKATP